MDIFSTFREQTFVWDTQKAAANLAKHSISFERAREVFFDPMGRYRDATADEERRDTCLGRTLRGELLVVIHIEREAEWVRIISARLANRTERKRYEDE